MDDIQFPVNLFDGKNCKAVDTINELRVYSELNNAEALYLYGKCLLYGTNGVKKNSLNAFNLYILSAIQGNKDAMYELGNFYQIGHGVRKNKEIAILLFQAAYGMGKDEALLSYAKILLEENEKYKKEAGLMLLHCAYDKEIEYADYYVEEYYPEALEYECNLDISGQEEVWYSTAIEALIEDVVLEAEMADIFGRGVRKDSIVYDFYERVINVCNTIVEENSSRNAFQEHNKKIEIDNSTAIAGNVSGYTLGVTSNASTLYGMNRFNARQAHGFAAERANHLADILSGKNAKILGDDNKVFGPDRLVDGVYIQSKYCKTGSESISACFKDGHFLYKNSDGTPMQIEVPAGQRQEAIRALQRRIRNGEVDGVTDPNQAQDIVREGFVTYNQAKNIAKAGTVESITYDAINGAIICGSVFGISTAISFAVSIWNKENWKDALRISASNGLRVGGNAFLTSVISSQLKRVILSNSTIENVLSDASESVFKLLGERASDLYIKSMKSGINIYGTESMKQASRIFQNELLTGTVSIALMATPDVIDLFRGRISGKQLAKSAVIGGTSVIAGGAGRKVGTIAGRKVGQVVGNLLPLPPGVGAFLGGLIGAAIAGSIAGKVAKEAMDNVIEDDSIQMISIIEDVFTRVVNDYILSKEEADYVMRGLEELIDIELLKDMYASRDREMFVEKMLESFLDDVMQCRKHIILPSVVDVIEESKQLLENIAKQYEKSA